MKQLYLLTLLFSILITNTTSTFMKKPEQIQERITDDFIPEEAIRLRILAHSDEDLDQEIKYAVRDRINTYISKQVHDIEHIDHARKVIEAEIPALEKIVAATLSTYDQQQAFEISFQENVPFPLKTYGPHVYPADDYEAILVTLGDGAGENWWCVLFPPLCFIDFFNEHTLVDAENEQEDEDDQPLVDEEDHTETSDIEVKFFLFELFNIS